MNLVRARSIQQKLNLILVATVVLALLLASVALLGVEAREAWRAAQRDLVTNAQVIGLASEAALAFSDRSVGEQNLRVLEAKPTVLTAALYDSEGRLFASYRAPGEPRAQPPGRAPPVGVEFGWQLATVVRPVLSDSEAIGSIYVQARHGLLGDIAEYIGWLVAVMVASLFGGLLLAHRLQKSLTEPILDVARVAQTVLERGTFEVRARKSTNDEVGHLVDGFNAMLDEIETRARVLQEANRALVASEARYQLAASGSSAGLWDWDMEARSMFYSPRFRSVMGYDDRELPDHPTSLLRIMHTEDRPGVQQALREHLRHDVPFQAECRLRERGGAWRWFLITGMALRHADRRPYRMAGSLIDVTERKQSEILLQEANRAKDSFLATLAHELRNPLAPLRTGLQILKNPNAGPPTVRRTLDTMDRQLTHMVRLIDDLLDISRINSGKINVERSRTTLRAAVQTALELSRPAIDAAGHALVVELPDQEIALDADETRLAQAFGNLLNNAAKYTPPGGQVRLRAWQAEGDAWVEIQDNGLGIPPAMLERVFQLFTQVEDGPGRVTGGLGIGLFLVRSLIELHGGSVSARSDGPGCGSTFTVRLPCAPAVAAGPAQPALPGADAGDPVPTRVLVVDDNVDAAETLATFLDMLGVQTRMAHEGPAVLAAAREFQPDVVLLDIGLPGMSGYEVARQLRADPQVAHVRLIALTGWGAEEDRRRAREAGFDHHLTKPVDVAVLEALLKEVAKS